MLGKDLLDKALEDYKIGVIDKSEFMTIYHLTKNRELDAFSEDLLSSAKFEMMYFHQTPTDPTIQSVVNKIISRSEIGIKKYNTTLDGNKGDFKYWLIHLQEELMDAVNYIERIIKEL